MLKIYNELLRINHPIGTSFVFNWLIKRVYTILFSNTLTLTIVLSLPKFGTIDLMTNY